MNEVDNKSPKIYRGFWWETTKTDKKYFGELTLYLDLYAILELYDDSENEFRVGHKIPLMHGSASSLVSLYDCIITGNDTTYHIGTGHKITKLAVTGPIFFNVFMESSDNLIIKRIWVRIFNDEQLANIGKEKLLPDGYEIGYAHDIPESKTVEAVFNDTNVSIQYYIAVKSNITGSYSTISFKPTFVLEIGNPSNFTDYEYLIRAFNRYLTLVAGQKVYFEELGGNVKSTMMPLEIYNVGEAPKYKSWSWFSERKPRYRVTAMFYEHPESLVAWLSKYKDLEGIINLFFNILDYQLDMESEFTILCQALEGYHRIKYDKYFVNPEEWLNKWKPEIMRLVNREIKDKNITGPLNKALSHAHELNLSDRIRELIQNIHNPYRNLITKGYKKIGSLAQEIAECRNKLSHRDKPGNIKRAQENLPKLLWRVKYLIALCLIQELELSEIDIETWFSLPENIDNVI